MGTELPELSCSSQQVAYSNHQKIHGTRNFDVKFSFYIGGCKGESFIACTRKVEHIVQFYQDDKFLIDAVGGFTGAALAAGDAALMLRTGAHREGVGRDLKN